MPFTAAAELPGAPICDLRGGEISGSFSEDGLTFEAVATYVWGTEENRGRTQKRWRGLRLDGR